MAGGVVGYLPEGLVAELLVERSRLEAERAEEDAPAAVRSRLFFGRFEKPLPVSLSAERLGLGRSERSSHPPQMCP